MRGLIKAVCVHSMEEDEDDDKDDDDEDEFYQSGYPGQNDVTSSAVFANSRYNACQHSSLKSRAPDSEVC